MDFAAIEPVRIAGLGQQLLGLLRIVRVGLDRQRVFHAFQHDAAVRLRCAERLGLAESLAVDREARGLAHARVGPRRLASHMSRKSR